MNARPGTGPWYSCGAFELSANVVQWERISRQQQEFSRVRRRDSVHVLVHVRLGRHCQSLRHPAKSNWRADLLLCVGYANPCVDVRLAATFQDLDSKPAAFIGIRVRFSFPAPLKSTT